MKRTPLFLSLLASTLLASFAHAGLKLPAIIGPNMVLQRDLENPVWGWADPGADVTVAIAGQSLQTKADQAGKWKVKLAPMAVSSAPVSMTIKSGAEELVLDNILVGEVWICSGQ